MIEQIDNYQIIEKIGQGGMGEVYRGVDIMLEREVAIKLLKPELSSREDIVQRFRSEAIALGRLNHGNIATLYNFGKFQDQYYMALEFVKGTTLDDVIKTHGALDCDQALNYAIQVLDGLAHAHNYNIVHRDIKPSNIVVTDNNVLKILDFGIARILEKARLTRSGHLVGTLEYVSPEQLQGKETDARADIYSTGILLYEMLTGHLPFEKETEYELIRSQIEEKPRPLRHSSKDIPALVDNAVLKALEKKSDKRYSSATEFSKELVRVLRLIPEVTRPSSNFHNKSLLINIVKDYPVLVALVFFMFFGGLLIINKKSSNLEKGVASADLNTSKAVIWKEIQDEKTLPANLSKPPEAANPVESTYLPPPKFEPAPPPSEQPVKKAAPVKPAGRTRTDKGRFQRAEHPSKTRQSGSRQKIATDPGIDKAAMDFFR